MAQSLNLNNVKFYNVAFTNSGLSRLAEVDAVVSFTVFMHMPLSQLVSYFEEASYILRPGGRFHFDCCCTSRDKSCRYDNVPSDELFTGRWFPDALIEKIIYDSGMYVISKPVPPYMVWKAAVKE
jgi:cyclopropane fatty-acyl-phospholipid synthase-like methyltransferase